MKIEGTDSAWPPSLLHSRRCCPLPSSCCARSDLLHVQLHGHVRSVHSCEHVLLVGVALLQEVSLDQRHRVRGGRGGAGMLCADALAELIRSARHDGEVREAGHRGGGRFEANKKMGQKSDCLNRFQTFELLYLL